MDVGIAVGKPEGMPDGIAVGKPEGMVVGNPDGIPCGNVGASGFMTVGPPPVVPGACPAPG
ncbi:MAG: hypothetical protein HUU21_39460, partial [Polyangiaceae bacterium]|nr:hypothetical protein [Polyangiaceae bacterium]